MTNSDSIPFSAAGDEEISAKPLDMKIAKKILGKKKVYPADKVAKVWDMGKVGEKLIRLSAGTLEWCAEQNAASKDNDWRLVYGPGQAIMVMFEKRGENEKRQPCFHPTYNFYPGLYHELNHMHKDYAEKSPWIAQTAKADYRLINFAPKFRKLFFAEQEKRIIAMGVEFFRTPAPVFAEAIMSIFMLTGERIAEDWYHLAPEKHMWGGYPVAIGRFIPYGLVIMPGYDGAEHSVVVSRGNDF